MWPFGRKKEKKPDPAQEQVQAFAAEFEAEEFVLVAVTGPQGLGNQKQEGDVLETITLPLTAWMDEEDGVVHEEAAVLTGLADERLLAYLRHCLIGNFIIKARVRPSREGGKFQLVDMPEPGMDPELKAIWERQVKPVTFEAEGFATFTLNQAAGLFQTEFEWQDSIILLSFDAKQDCQRCADVICEAAENLEQYDASACALVAQQLLEIVREKAEDESVDAAAFVGGLDLDSVQADESGNVTLWYTSDLLWDSGVRVTCAGGKVVEATIEE